MSGRLSARCPAKVNLGLRVLGRRDDGYHEIDTVFQAIDLWDRLEVEPADELSLECAAPGVPTDERNLVLRAARILLRRAGPRARRGARLVLHKEIPPAGGLGGGSSDAAGALLLLRRHWKLELEAAELAAIAAELGADVPFFLHGGRARGTGRGERIEPLRFPGSAPLLLGFPPFGVATEEAYRGLATRLTLPANDVSVSRRFAHKSRRVKDLATWGNDLERVVFHDHPQLREFRDGLLEEGAQTALLSGSGATVFGLFDDPGRRSRAQARLAARFVRWTLRSSRTIGGGIAVGPAAGG